MRKNVQFLIVLTCVALMAFINARKVNALSIDNLSNPTYTYSSNGFKYMESVGDDTKGKQALYYAEYKSDKESSYEWVIHSIRKESKTTRSTVMTIAKDYEEKTGRKVIFAANGDYFDLNSGSNMESYVNNGVVISKGRFATKHSIGFNESGFVALGRMTEVEKRLQLIVNGESTLYQINKFNEAPTNDEIAIYNTPGTYTIPNTGKYIITSTSANLNQCPVYGTSKRMSTGTKVNDDAITLKSGQFAIVCADSEINDYFFATIKYGLEVNLVEVPSGSFKDASWVLGGYDMLVNNGVVNTTPHTDNDGNGNAPRTFIGFKEDGTCFVSVVDGRQPTYSVGITVKEEAALAASLGAKYALELDGGGSSTVVVRLDDVLTLRNRPSDGTMRTVSNAILLVEKPKQEDPLPDPTPDPLPDPTPAPSGCNKNELNDVVSTILSISLLTTSIYYVIKMKRG